MTAPLIAPVIPSSAAPRHRGRGAQGRVATPLPLASPPDAPPVTGDLIYGIGRIDASGALPTGPSLAPWTGAAVTG